MCRCSALNSLRSRWINRISTFALWPAQSDCEGDWKRSKPPSASREEKICSAWTAPMRCAGGTAGDAAKMRTRWSNWSPTMRRPVSTSSRWPIGSTAALRGTISHGLLSKALGHRRFWLVFLACRWSAALKSRPVRSGAPSLWTKFLCSPGICRIATRVIPSLLFPSKWLIVTTI